MSFEIGSIIRLTPPIRKKASANVWGRKEQAFDMDFLYESLNLIVEETTCGKDTTPLFERLRTIDLTKFLKESPGLNRFFTCTFFSKRFAWVSKNEAGEYRYFSKIKEGHGFYAFDLFDLLTIALNMTSKELIRYLEGTHPFHSATAWAKEQKDKLEENRKMLKPSELSSSPYLQRILRGGVEVLESFLSYGAEHINGKHLSDGNHAVFFLSTNYFKEKFFPQKSISTLNQWVNLFAVLGLIEKTTNVPAELQTEAEKQQALKKKHNHVSFYIIPSFKNVFKQAEVRAKELVFHRISYHQLTKKVVLSIFGKAVHDHVYVQVTHGRKRKEKASKERLSLEWLDTFFRIQLNEQGFIVKKELEEDSILSKNAFSQAWNELVRKHRCEVGTPTREEQQQFALKHRQIIARRNGYEVESNVWRNQEVLPWDFFDEPKEIDAHSLSEVS